MIKVLFWNINRKSGFEDTICEILNKENIDILLLAEAMNIDDKKIETKSKLRKVNSTNPRDQIHLTPRFYSTNYGFKLTHYHTVQNTKRLVFSMLKIPYHKEILLGGIHFPSKLEYNGQTQTDIANSYTNWLLNTEGRAKNKRTILFGDFNMNPFEIGMIGPKTFNATLTNNLAKQGKRTFQRDKFDYFYNPMWNFMGDIKHTDGTNKLPGSYYFYTTINSEATFWNVFDNVICRSKALQYLDLSSINYLMKSGKHNFVNIDKNHNYSIDEIHYSDHLPLFFILKK